MKKKFLAIPAIALCALMVSGAYAFGGFGAGGNEAAKEALENKDYGAFVSAVSENFRERFTEEKFTQAAERFQLRQGEMQAIEDGDYGAWAEAIESRPGITDFITEENFGDFAAMHNARQEGDFETAQALAEELGLSQFQGKGFGKGPGMGGMNGMHRMGGHPLKGMPCTG